MSPGHLREFFVPPFAAMVKGMKSLGLPVIMHNDGKLHDVIGDLAATGIDGYHPVERAAGMDLGEIKKQFGKTLCPVGNINNKTTMVTGTPEEVEKEAADCIRTAGPGGGYILATDHSLHDDIPVENIKAYIGAAEKYGRYPIQLD
jgi:uroporphyrinogen decarboxylase